MNPSSPTRPAGAARRSRRADFLGDERGETAIEYGLIASLIIVVLIVALQNFNGATTKLYNKITGAMNTMN